MSQSPVQRGWYWWLWPDFHESGDARDVAKVGGAFCGLIAVSNVVIFYLRYYEDGDLSHLLAGLVIAVVYSAFAYGTLRMSRVAVTGALVLFVADHIYYMIAVNRLSLVGLGPLPLWYLIHANRAVSWFHKDNEAHTAIPGRTGPRKCDNCGAAYNLTDYRVDAPVWSCSRCHAALPREQPY